MALQSYPIPNLINGVSQQAETQRRDTQAEEQINCLNDPVDGCLARPGSRQIGFIPEANFEDSYSFDISRSDEEKYRVFIMDRDIRVVNLLTGLECAVDFPAGTDYLQMGSSDAAKHFKARTVEDTTFITNSTVIPQIDQGVRSVARPFEVLLHVKQASYGEGFTIDINGNVYGLSVPVSTTSNAENYIRTDNVAYAIATLLNGNNPGSPWGTSTGTNLPAIGYTVVHTGSTVYVSSPTDFTVQIADGRAGTSLIPIKGEVGKISDLPTITYPIGFVIKVRGDKTTDADDYYLRYAAPSVWEECPAPNLPLGLDADTMPHVLVNTAPNEFEFRQPEWAERLSGDGALTSPDPGFVGRGIIDIFFDKQRLGLMTTAGAAWSKTRQYYTFFPDSAQVRVDTDPIDIDIVGTRPSTLAHAVQWNEQMFFWADEVQYVRAEAETLTEATIDVPSSTNFSFNPDVPPRGAGSYLYFLDTDAESGYSSVWEYFVVPQGTSKDALRTNDHCPKYILGRGTHLMAAPNAKALAVLTDENPRHLYFYNQFLKGQEKLQSAWHRWEMPAGHVIIGGAFDKDDLVLTIQRDDGVSIEKVDISSVQRDPESTYLTRLDIRLDDTQVGRTYVEAEDRTYIVLPFEVGEGETYTIVSRLFDGYEAGVSEPPGVLAKLVAMAGNEIVVEGDWEANSFFVGVVPAATRTFSTFYPKDDNGAILADRTQIYRVIVACSDTGYTRAEVEYTNGPTRITEFTGRILGSPANRFDEVVLDDVNLNIGVNSKNTECKITLINDTFLPSAWQSADVWHRTAKRAAGRGQGQS